jgi:hypothetical protein
MACGCSKGSIGTPGPGSVYIYTSPTGQAVLVAHEVRGGVREAEAPAAAAASGSRRRSRATRPGIAV